MPDITVTDLCTQRERDGDWTWGCVLADQHDDGGWHYDINRGRWWKRTRTHVMSIPDGPPTSPPPGGANRKENSMSFSFNAVGTKEEVVAQLEAAPIGLGEHRFNEFGADLCELLGKHFAAETAAPGSGYEYRYVAKASGHGGGSVPLSLQMSVEPLYVAATPAEEPQIISGGGQAS